MSAQPVPAIIARPANPIAAAARLYVLIDLSFLFTAC
jgi:hypothetical protein